YSNGILDRVTDQEDLVGVTDKLGKEYWGRMGDTATGEDISKDVKVGIGVFFGVIDIGVIGIDKYVGIFGRFGNVGTAITNRVDLMGDIENVGVLFGVEVDGIGCFINVSRGKKDMFAKGVDVKGGAVRVHVVELSFFGMVVSNVGVVT
ncbi:hypothetical protein KI387_000062, partial [Taxus chinensis]